MHGVLGSGADPVLQTNKNELIATSAALSNDFRALRGVASYD